MLVLIFPISEGKSVLAFQQEIELRPPAWPASVITTTLYEHSTKERKQSIKYLNQ